MKFNPRPKGAAWARNSRSLDGIRFLKFFHSITITHLQTFFYFVIINAEIVPSLLSLHFFDQPTKNMKLLEMYGQSIKWEADPCYFKYTA